MSAGQPQLRDHHENQSDGKLYLYPATEAPITNSLFDSRIQNGWRYLSANGISKHNTGRFPNADNPNTIRAQSLFYRVPEHPQQTGVTVAALGQVFGVALNGVPFDPGAAEFYRGDASSGWQYEPLSGAIPLGLDEGMAHVQPDGSYHYHGSPALLLQRLDIREGEHSPLVGWAADGFPIYAYFGYADPDPRTEAEAQAGLSVQELHSSWRLKRGARPSGNGQPGGTYDGTFTADYEYQPGLGQLDQCNGRYTVTPEFPNGTYAYFLTHEWPVIPRCFSGTPSADFRHGPGDALSGQPPARRTD